MRLTPRRNSPRATWPMSLAIEAAEVLEHFQWQTSRRDPDALAGELADVALYLLQLASMTGIDLEQAILDKLALNQTRTGRRARYAAGWRESGNMRIFAVSDTVIDRLYNEHRHRTFS